LDKKKKVRGRNIFITVYWSYGMYCLLRDVISHFLVTPLFVFGFGS